MSRKHDNPLVIDDLTGGRNGNDSPISLDANQCVEALNVDWWSGSFAGKRNGASAIGVTFSAGGPFTSTIASLLTYVPGADETAAELWAVDGAGVVGRLAGATQWTAPTLKDSTQTTVDWSAVGLGGFFHLMYDTAQNRSHVFDASLSKVRRSGLATPVAPTVAQDGAGALSWTRFYASRWVDISGADTRRRSERSPSVSITIAAKAGATVTRPALASEDETHWEVLASDTGVAGTWYRLSQVVAATTTYDDTAATIPTTTPDASDGINYPPPSAKFVAKINARLVMGGAWETSGGFITPKNNRVWWTPVIGASDIGDLERVPSGYSLDVGDAITGIGGPLQGALYVFGYRNIWKLQPTGLPGANAFRAIDISSGIGCIRHQSIVMAEDENGSPALYFWSHRGPYRYGVNGLQWLGNDVLDVASVVNLGASTMTVHGVYHAEKNQVWWWVATGASNQPDTKLVFDTRLGRTVAQDSVRNGWSKHDGLSAAAYCSTMFSATIGASMGRNRLPYVGQVNGNGRVWRCDDSTANDDGGTAFQAYVETRDHALAGFGKKSRVNERHLIGRSKAGVTITCTVNRDAGVETTTSTVSLTPVAAETILTPKFESGELAGCKIVRFRVGDGSAVTTGAWVLDAFAVIHSAQEAA